MNTEALFHLNITNAAYIVAAILFIVGLKQLGSPATARNGNRMSALAMLVAVVATVVGNDIASWEFIIGGAIVGSAIGAFSARKVAMTSMPQLVAIFNGFGGAASAAIAAAELIRLIDDGSHIAEDVSITIMASVIVGGVTLTGSFIAFGKLQGIVPTRPILLPIRNVINVALLIGMIASTVWLVIDPSLTAFMIAGAIALALGILVVIPIGGADMPVVIALLNSYSGIAGAATGFVLGNTVLIIAGSLVGASGLILTRIMTKAMNRSLANVMLGGFGVEDGAASAGGEDERPVTSIQPEDAAMMLAYAQSVIFVPGYGLAVAQAQHQVRELADLLKEKGISVRYAIHPVAGRMPGHMNVLLAEANVPYDELKDLDEINGEFQRTDVAVVIGANDVTNPSARTDKSSPIYGMPILNVDAAQSVIMMKRGMSSGFAGVQNELFFLDKTQMLFGDAKDSVEKITAEVKDL
ncbi:MAG: NAD(P)(+) transhydrogenase (Re/Si-specific) subunit beta [Chloroflexi bacterium]|jgi:NAD(P) transhydrogenase subunit beta|nr:NAD(P)(+) transhydrogenase (Re/Si-specific) subunit beta [Chloroflexota bacterium]MBT3864100.1 NAD(P)(+) transhydrogenase (Re/Si-specific) subunit beta [Chloroflexota bacterium]MBT4143409.1 NAD(P)(+) transhydrogenase (Re/Si-specific) subunit beta [Chloroflexota bacterium]MBT4341496.1 NAD(P)(+) transhydrogenase (Re/Si-specific) subunit beta [Chloroflexota bacterium]MBT5252810.1 NAD(P)(+) transhydrogenase (Re/Si-specific) subunit beta [Chloroflexota bacterium]